MAEAVERAIERRGYLVAEAGTGTGKTLAYLVPAVLSGRRVIVSTATKTLQEQIWGKDIPLLRDACGLDFEAAYLKGRSNYYCLERGSEFARAPTFAVREEAALWPRIEAWAAADRDRRPERGRPARPVPHLARPLRHQRELPGPGVPALRGLLRHPRPGAGRRRPTCCW